MKLDKLTIAFTGHRPNKLPGGYDILSGENRNLAKRLSNCLKDIILLNGASEIKFVVGGAIGVDTIACSIALLLRKKLTDYKISVEMAVPFENQSCKWSENDIGRYFHHIESCDKITYVDELNRYKVKGVKVGEYSPLKMQNRNEYMVNHCHYLVAVWNGTKGGTLNCINYAESLGKLIMFVDI